MGSIHRVERGFSRARGLRPRAGSQGGRDANLVRRGECSSAEPESGTEALFRRESDGGRSPASGGDVGEWRSELNAFGGAQNGRCPQDAETWRSRSALERPTGEAEGGQDFVGGWWLWDVEGDREERLLPRQARAAWVRRRGATGAGGACGAEGKGTGGARCSFAPG